MERLFHQKLNQNKFHTKNKLNKKIYLRNMEKFKLTMKTFLYLSDCWNDCRKNIYDV